MSFRDGLRQPFSAVRWGWLNRVALPIAHHLRDDRDGCDRCGQPRSPGFVRAEVRAWYHNIIPEVGRYCLDCRLELTTGGDA
ncbi:hypothetical protein [Halorhabdus sp. CUG00001]|uniref:hypothetical protein n=1 Tax=Halorhabdus sp. CUG00001 TaxID=2600297 RepID=UPI00131D8E4A|nr:hypothetical protein [Halorhabdus sp. CUG00001]